MAGFELLSEDGGIVISDQTPVFRSLGTFSSAFTVPGPSMGGVVSFDVPSSSPNPPIVAIRALDIPDGGFAALLPCERPSSAVWRVRVLLAGSVASTSGTLRIAAFQPDMTGMPPAGDGGLEVFDEFGNTVFNSAYHSLRLSRSIAFSNGVASLPNVQADSFVTASCFPKNLILVGPGPTGGLWRYVFEYQGLRRSGAGIVNSNAVNYQIITNMNPPSVLPPVIPLTGFLMELKHA